MNIDEAMKELKPYVTGVRYVGELTIVDTFLREKWVIPESQVIDVEIGKDNYYMFYSERDGIGFDEILLYIKSVIKHNLEREETLELYKATVVKLRVFFKEHKLAELKQLKFSVGISDDLTSTEVDDWDMDTEVITEEPVKEPVVIKESVPVKEPNVKPSSNRSVEKPVSVEVQEGEPPGVTEIEGDFEKFTIPDTVELPPRKDAGKVIIEEPELPEIKVVCKCGPNDVCPICAESKGM